MKKICPILFLLFFLFPYKALAQDYSSVKINEIYPTPSEGKEWVEIYNPNQLDINSWKIEELTTSGNTTTHELGNLGNNIFIVYEFSTNKLNSGGDTVTLKDQNNNVIDYYTYSNDKTNQSFSRIPDGTGDFVLTSTPTKGSNNIFITPSPSPTSSPSPSSTPTPTSTSTSTPTPTSTSAPNYSGISLNEIFPTPQEGKEWIEIYNPNNLNLENWTIQELSSNGNPTSHDLGNLGNSTFLTYEFSANKLNTDKDTLTLKDENGNTIDTYSYTSSVKGKSWAKINGSWCLASPTRANANTSCDQVENEDDQESDDEDIDPTSTASPSKPKASSVASKNEIQRDLPEIGLATLSAGKLASVAGVADERALYVDSPQEKTKVPIIALVIAGFGLLLMGGASAPFLIPKLKSFLDKIRKVKKKNNDLLSS